MKKVQRWKIVWKLLPAIGELVAALVEAAHKDSPGGKKITPDERDQILAAFWVALRPVLLRELAKKNG